MSTTNLKNLKTIRIGIPCADPYALEIFSGCDVDTWITFAQEGEEFTPAEWSCLDRFGYPYPSGRAYYLALSRAWSNCYINCLEDETGINLAPDRRAALDSVGFYTDSWGSFDIEVDVSAEALRALFDRYGDRMQSGMLEALRTRSGFEPFGSAIEEAQSLRIDRIRPSLFVPALSELLDWQESEEIHGVLSYDGFLPDSLREEVEDIFYTACHEEAQAIIRDHLGADRFAPVPCC